MATDNSNRTKFTVLADSFHIKGHSSVLPGARVTDYLNKAGDFIALTNAEVWQVGTGRKLMSAPFISINRGHIEIIVPDEASAV